jgi:hypothetical protein
MVRGREEGGGVWAKGRIGKGGCDLVVIFEEGVDVWGYAGGA